MPRSEVQRMRREARDSRKSLKTREREDRERREKDLADNEKWKDLAESREDRVTSLRVRSKPSGWNARRTSTRPISSRWPSA
jgi:hypothetical protein